MECKDTIFYENKRNVSGDDLPWTETRMKNSLFENYDKSIRPNSGGSLKYTNNSFQKNNRNNQFICMDINIDMLFFHYFY